MQLIITSARTRILPPYVESEPTSKATGTGLGMHPLVQISKKVGQSLYLLCDITDMVCYLSSQGIRELKASIASYECPSIVVSFELGGYRPFYNAELISVASFP